ncbi:MAG: hypothetical protein A2756_01680 [Candidatus Ryanbacteria bacterium RIFCSPHIGHO2_01_FULL_48_27]|uniref:PNPLA domain-containing protein n=1 Tax=Candidatus Ryanbacteria bacterium RIFCSPHIGHO2_01_FULL_48_27 TaxID=1802115 RepID=A0A1G2G4I1_9BACT|nr:MAG: hypothetical protein A2756_01680 [Candidatus Ryanbacteria bacterium RIFCSPHIGHO2_01_FULL_48_27]
MSSQKKIAIVCSGGGMRCAYTGGVLVALAEKHKFTSPDIIIAASGSAAFAFYYLTRQYKSIEHIATELLSTPKFISFLRPFKIMDIDYLVDEVFKKQAPLNIGLLSDLKTKYYIAATDSNSRTRSYFCNDSSVDIFEILRATKAIPFFYNKKVVINGIDYIDGTVSTSFDDALLKARELGATHIIGIDNRPREGLHADDFILIANRRQPAQLLTRDSRKLRAAFDLGFSDAARSAELSELLVNVC